jgi:hypothetical protein
MKKILFFAGLLVLLFFIGCTLDDGVSVDPDLVDSWVQTTALGGPWLDLGASPRYMGFRFASGGKIYIIYSDDGVNWNEIYSGVNLTKAEEGAWASNAGGHGTYTIVGDNMTWVNDATASTSYYERL